VIVSLRSNCLSIVASIRCLSFAGGGFPLLLFPLLILQRVKQGGQAAKLAIPATSGRRYHTRYN
jgi:hypothetical protein